METEDQIIYQILEEYTGGKINNDKVIGEREIRSLMRSHRARIIRDSYSNGMTLTEQEFQNFGLVTLLPSFGLYTYQLPQIIRLKNNAGIRAFVSSGYSIPIMSREDFRLDLTNPMGQFRPKAYMSDDTLYIATGGANADLIDQGLALDSINASISTGLQIQIEMILFDPSSHSTYDFTSSPYPLAPELIVKLKYDIGQTNMEKMTVTKQDETGNSKDDTIKYYNQNRAQ